MATEYTPIDITHTPELRKAAEDVRKTKRPRLLQIDGEDIAVIAPIGKKSERSVLKPKSKADMDAFWSSFGGWSDVDTDALQEAIYESRRISTKPRPEL